MRVLCKGKNMKAKMKIHMILPSALVAACLWCGESISTAQNYTQEPVTISSERIRGVDGKVYYCHKVLDHQTLYSVAKVYGVSIDDICKANPEQDLKAKGLKKDTIIYIPYVQKETATKVDAGKEDLEETRENQEEKTEVKQPETVREKAAETVAEPKKAKKGEDYFIHVTRWYEDLDDIAYKYSVPADVLMKYNGLSSRKLKNRQKIKVPVNYQAEESTATPETETGNGSEGDGSGDTGTETGTEDEDEGNAGNYGRNQRYAVNALMMLPFGASASPNENSFDFYSGVLLAVEKMKEEGVDIDLSVYDVSSGLPITAERLAASDFTIGPVSRDQISKVLELAPESTAVISPLDPKSADLAGTHANMIQAPATLQEQYQDLVNWLASECRYNDKVFIIKEKGAKATTSTELMAGTIVASSLTVTEYSYNILEGREAVNRMESMMSKSGVNRVIINSESEAFVNDAVRNLATLLYRKNNVVLYSPSRIRSFETIDAENLHNLNTRISTSYYVDYNSRATSDFLMKYRALYGTEPTQFAFQGYDLAYYFIGKKASLGKNWLKHLEICPVEKMLQTDLQFRRCNDGGYTNKGVRRIIYKPDYVIAIAD